MYKDFSSLTHTHKTLCILIHKFSLLALLPLYIYPPITFHVIPCQIHRDKKLCQLPSIFWWHLPSYNIIVSSNFNPYELTTTKEGGFAFYIWVTTPITILMLRSDVVNLWVLKIMWLIMRVWNVYFVVELRRTRKTHSISTLIYSINFLQRFFFFFFLIPSSK